MPEELRLNNATALGKALLLVTAVPWTISVFFYSAMHFTYGRDADRLRVSGRGHGDSPDTTLNVLPSHASLNLMHQAKLRALHLNSCSSSEFGEESARVSRSASRAELGDLETPMAVAPPLSSSFATQRPSAISEGPDD